MECEGISRTYRKRATMSEPLTTAQIKELRDDYIVRTVHREIEELEQLADRIKQGLAAWLHYPNSLEHDTLQLEHVLTYISTLSRLVSPLFDYALGSTRYPAESQLASQALELLESRPALPYGAKLEQLLKDYDTALRLEKKQEQLERAQSALLADIETANEEII
jgi:hypothetical protein